MQVARQKKMGIGGRVVGSDEVEVAETMKKMGIETERLRLRD